VNAAERLREALTDQRRRGVSFEIAWARAYAVALQDEPSPFEQRHWILAFGATRGAWAAAYHGVHVTAGDALRDLRHRGDLVA
jgi:hypothetical protein